MRCVCGPRRLFLSVCADGAFAPWRVEPEPEPEQVGVDQGRKKHEGSEDGARNTVVQLPRLDAADIIPEDGDAPISKGFDTDHDDTTEAPQYVYVQHPITKRISRQKKEEMERDRGRKEDEKRQLESAEDAAAGVDVGHAVLDAINKVTATAFLLCQSLFAGVAVLLLVMSTAVEDFVEYYSPLAGTTRNVVTVLSSLCILGSFERHSREAAAGWQGRGYGRSVTVITLYCVSFLLTLLNTPMDDRANICPVLDLRLLTLSVPSAVRPLTVTLAVFVLSPDGDIHAGTEVVQNIFAV